MKCSCTVCGKPIEYDATAAGMEIGCPHCGKPTRLAAYSAAVPPPMPQHASAPAPQRKSNAWIIILVLGLCAVIAVPIFGLLAAFLNQDWRLYLPAWAVALIGFMREWPSE